MPETWVSTPKCRQRREQVADGLTKVDASKKIDELRERTGRGQ
jgi:hypothetical protein